MLLRGNLCILLDLGAGTLLQESEFNFKGLQMGGGNSQADQTVRVCCGEYEMVHPKAVRVSVSVTDRCDTTAIEP
jgi:hypothetical protein